MEPKLGLVVQASWMLLSQRSCLSDRIQVGGSRWKLSMIVGIKGNWIEKLITSRRRIRKIT